MKYQSGRCQAGTDYQTCTGSIKALGFLRGRSCVLQDFPSPQQMGCHINHEADDHYRLRALNLRN